MRSVFLVVSLLAACSVSAQTTQDSVKRVITDLFKAMNDADSAGVVNLFAPGAVIHGLGKAGVKLEKAEEIGASMKRLKKGQLDERIQFEAVHIDANLASV